MIGICGLERGGAMALLRWSNKKYSVGVKALDEQHVNLIKRLNELHAVMMKGRAQDIAGPLQLKIKAESLEHFATEERLMEDTQYPGLAEQRAAHLDLTLQVKEFMARHEQSDPTMYPELLYFLRDWLDDHMLTLDRKYTLWMNEHGVY
jgi:hemerythrin-like metal-binding protein